MRIAIDATPIINRSGTGYYTQKLIEFLGRADSENQYVLFCPSGYQRHLERPAMFHYPNFHVEQVRIFNQGWQVAWKQLALPRLVRKFNPDIIHFPAFIASLRLDLPSVLTVHDLCYSLFPETFSRVHRHYYKYMIPRSIAHCDAIIVDSLSTRKDLLERVKTKNGSVKTVHLGVDPVTFFKVTDEERRAAVRDKYALPQLFLLSVGTLEPRKNIPSLIRAFSYGVVAKALPHHLVVTGRRGWLFDEIFREVGLLNLSGRIHFPGYVDQADLPALYSMAQALVYPSLYEGFGLPCLEAMSCGTPVIASGVSSLPEIVAQNALKVDPLSVDSIAEALNKICVDSDLREQLSEAGIRHASRFSWLTTAKKTLEVYADTRNQAS
ncbi:MAG: glycosyltransferase family 1 protein [Candidatus Abyssobacteria bacterium SURF_5]|uniref:Glycosyltransferase family 1 protein n=1 Tax=Abyssobacteria bacterium (strain SURF_5) TaxID=2093360 RepID=A0A3A4P3Z8_ABYX5|nr:MAG: glycosyltransferase family 1 protein [Candidatus Abyssubacteria bacterium SURF_5]